MVAVVAAGAVGLLLLAAGAAAVWYFLLRRPAQETASAPPAVEAMPTPLAPPTLEPVSTPQATLQPTALATPAPTATPTPVATVLAARPTTPSPTATPARTPTPPRSPTPAKTPGRPTPTPAAAAAATAAEALRAQQQVAQIAGLISQAEAAYSAQRFDAAVALYEDALRLDPAHSQASVGRQAAVAAAFCWKRAFVPGRTSVQAAKSSRDSSLQGFESADVKVAKAPDYSGMIEFVASPTRVKPGDSYSVRVNLTNDGKKALRLAGATVTVIVNGERSPVPATPPAGELQPRQNATLAQTGGSWSESTRSWTVEVSVTTTHGETFSNQLAWR